MKTETLKKIATACGIMGIVGGAASLGANVIHMARPETANLPSEHVSEIKRIVMETVKEASEQKT